MRIARVLLSSIPPVEGSSRGQHLELVLGVGATSVDSIATIRSSLAAGNPSAAEFAVHSLKGVTGSLGLTAMFAASGQLDELLRQPTFDEGRAADLVDDLETAARDLARALEA